MKSRPILTVRLTARTPVHSTHRIALVGEAPGPNTDPEQPMLPLPPTSAAGRLCSLLGLSVADYLRVFARTNLLQTYPGPAYPVHLAAPRAPGLAALLSPRPLLLLGQGVASAFRYPSQEVLTWKSYLLGDVHVTAAVVPHPSGRNLFYNIEDNRSRVRDWVRTELTRLGCDEDILSQTEQ